MSSPGVVEIRSDGNFLAVHLRTVIFKRNRLYPRFFGESKLDTSLEITPTAAGQAAHLIDVSLHVGNHDRVAGNAHKVILIDILLSFRAEKFHVGVLATVFIDTGDIQENGVAETLFITAALDEIVIKPSRTVDVLQVIVQPEFNFRVGKLIGVRVNGYGVAHFAQGSSLHCYAITRVPGGCRLIIRIRE